MKGKRQQDIERAKRADSAGVPALRGGWIYWL